MNAGSNDVFITGIGSYLPRLMHTNESLPPLEKPLAQEELDKIGVTRRGWAGEGESIPEMAAQAVQRALADAGAPASSIDLIVLANWTQRRFIPEWAPKLQQLIGAPQAFAFDVCTACAGFVYGTAIAHGFLANPRFERAVVVAAETTSRRGRPGSKSTLIFGDAAGAVVLERGAGRGAQVLDYELQTDGSYFDMMSIDENGWVKTHLPQKELNQLAAKSFTMPSRALLERAGLTIRDVDWVVPHSGTAGIQATLIRSLEVPAEKVLSNFDVVGNVSSAAIPVALQHFVSSGKIQPGQLVLSPTTGTGWYSAALLYRMGAR
jgi:3-oxoacyl-[acyl-carrier-protein] synthase-3